MTTEPVTPSVPDLHAALRALEKLASEWSTAAGRPGESNVHNARRAVYLRCRDELRNQLTALLDAHPDTEPAAGVCSACEGSGRGPLGTMCVDCDPEQDYPFPRQAPAPREAVDRMSDCGRHCGEDLPGVTIHCYSECCHGPWPDPGTEGGIELTCNDCQQPYECWFADNLVWNLVVGGGPDCKDDPGAMLCPRCFALRAQAVYGEGTRWHLRLDRPAEAAERVEECDHEFLSDTSGPVAIDKCKWCDALTPETKQALAPPAEPAEPAERGLVHRAPVDDSTGLTPCCGRTPFELPHTDRICNAAHLVTCNAPGPLPTEAPPIHFPDGQCNVRPDCTNGLHAWSIPCVLPTEAGALAFSDKPGDDTAPLPTEAGDVALAALILAHTMHASWNEATDDKEARWWAECLVCDWTDRGEGTLFEAHDAHNLHVARAVIAAGWTPPADRAGLRERVETLAGAVIDVELIHAPRSIHPLREDGSLEESVVLHTYCDECTPDATISMIEDAEWNEDWPIVEHPCRTINFLRAALDRGQRHE